MKRVILAVLMLAGVLQGFGQRLATDNKMARPLGQVMDQVAKQFGVRFKYNVDTTGLVLNYADSRIRPYSLEETLTNILSVFEFKAWDEGKNTYKIKPYEYYRRYDSDGVKKIAWLNSLYADSTAWEARRQALRKEVRERMGVDEQLAHCMPLDLNSKTPNPMLGKERKHDGYTVQNIALELQPGYYICGSIFKPDNKLAKKKVAKAGKYPLIICPIGHWSQGRYTKELQMRYGNLARMGCICISYDLFGWGESELQVGKAAHESSLAHLMQCLSGIRLLDYALTRKDVDPTRVASNGGSGGGTHATLLAAIDDRITACCPVVSVCSHFDGGCPCESGLPIQYSLGGTSNIEILATFAPKPIMIVGDEGDWTHTYPEIEFPYLHRIYGFYHADDQLHTRFLKGERHDFGPNKRQAVYDFFRDLWKLAYENEDEDKVTIEDIPTMCCFSGKALGNMEYPADFETNSKRLIEENFDKEGQQLYFEQKWASGLSVKAREWTASLNLQDPEKAKRVEKAILEHLTTVTKWHNEHPGQKTVPHGINPRTGERLRNVDLDIIADGAMPVAVHDTLMKRLYRDLNEEQVEQILDKYTVGKVAFTLKGYHEIVPNMTKEEDEVCLKYLKEARERAIDYKSMKEISEIFGIAKDKCELYFNTHGRNWKQLYQNYVKKRKQGK